MMKMKKLLQPRNLLLALAAIWVTFSIYQVFNPAPST